MNPTTFTQDGPGPPPDASSRALSETAQQELDALRAVLDRRLAALESALADPGHCGSLETLVLDLARVATDEVSAATRLMVLVAEVNAKARADAAWTQAQAWLAAQQSANVALSRELEQSYAALQTERGLSAAHLRNLEDLQGALDLERTTNAGLRETLEQAEQKMAAEHAKVVEIGAAKDQCVHELGQAQAAATRQTEALTRLHEELAAALSHAEACAAEVAAARLRADALEQQRNDVETARNESERLYEAAVLDRAALARELETAHTTAGAASAEAGERLRALDTDRANLARTCLDAEARLEAATGERAALAAERETLRQALSAARDEAQAASEQIAALEHAKVFEIGAAQDQCASELGQAQAAAIRQTEALTRLHEELAAALSHAEACTAEVAAARLRADALEQQRNDVETARNESERLYEAAVLDRAALARELETARTTAGAASAEAGERLRALDTDRANLARTCLDAEARLEAATGERAVLMAERETLRQALSAARDEAQAASEQIAAAEHAKVVEIGAAQDQCAYKLVQARAAATRQTEALTRLHDELAAALSHAETCAAEVAAAKVRADALEQQRNDFENAWLEAEALVESLARSRPPDV